jgi:23S rRNA (cytosine1962-C5)-methyltransferase
MKLDTLILEPQQDYVLLDSGNGEKLERYGRYVLRRPDPQALWEKLHPQLWSDADGTFVRGIKSASWKMAEGMSEDWQITLAGLKFIISPTAFKHTGVFPEQASNWTWMMEKIKGAGKPVSVLNLFAYTGGASIAAAAAGASVTHVDGSRSAIGWAQDNAKASGVGDKPIRYILDDVRKFVAREINRGKKYDGIILDPPAFGHGAKKEVWNIETDLSDLLSMISKLLSPSPLFIIFNGYSSGYSAIAYAQNLAPIVSKFGGTLQQGELTIAEQGSGRLLPCGIFARWSK